MNTNDPLLNEERKVAFEVEQIRHKSKLTQSAFVAIRILSFIFVFYLLFLIATKLLMFIVLNTPIIEITASTSSQGAGQESLRRLRANLLSSIRRTASSHLGFIRPFEVVGGLGIMAVRGIANRFRRNDEQFILRNPLQEYNDFAASIFEFQRENQLDLGSVRSASSSVSKRREVFVLSIFFLGLFILIYLSYRTIDYFITSLEYRSYREIKDDEEFKRKNLSSRRRKSFNED